MHQNSRFNILQADGNCNPLFVVIDGQRTDSGHAAPGAKVVSVAMPRESAIVLADKMQAEQLVTTSPYSLTQRPSGTSHFVVTIARPHTAYGMTFIAPQIILLVRNECMKSVEVDFKIFQQMSPLKQERFLDKLRKLTRYEHPLLSEKDLALANGADDVGIQQSGLF